MGHNVSNTLSLSLRLTKTSFTHSLKVSQCLSMPLRKDLRESGDGTVHCRNVSSLFVYEYLSSWNECAKIIDVGPEGVRRRDGRGRAGQERIHLLP